VTGEALFLGLLPLPPGAALCGREITDVVTTPDTASENALYVCLDTAVESGADGAPFAYARGCRSFLCARRLSLPSDADVLICEEPAALLGILSQRCYGEPARHMTVLGITGTHGKTSVARMLVAMLQGKGWRTGAVTTDGVVSPSGCVKTAGAIAPNAADLARELALFRKEGADFAVLELSAYQLRYEAHRGIAFAAVLLTNLEPHHIGKGLHPDREAYYAAKQKLFHTGAPIALLPSGFCEFAADGREVSYGEGGEIGMRGLTPCTNGPHIGYRFLLCHGGEEQPVFCPVPAPFAVRNLVAAASLALAAGMTLKEICETLTPFPHTGRMEPIASGGGRTVFLDTAYEEKALIRVLAALRTFFEGRVCVLLGSVGGRALSRRAPLGAAAVAYADFAYFTADDPDGEDPEQIFRDMVADVEDRARYRFIGDRKTAIEEAVGELRPHDVLLILGKATDETQLVAGKREPFCDRAVAREALARML